MARFRSVSWPCLVEAFSTRKVDVRLPEKKIKVPWREAGPPNHDDDKADYAGPPNHHDVKVDSDQ